MLKYLAALARAERPVRSRRIAIARLSILALIIAVAPTLVDWASHPSRTHTLDHSLDVLQAIAFGVLLTILIPSIALYDRPRGQRERFLKRAEDQNHLVGTVYLGPGLVDFLRREGTMPVSPYAESVSLTSTSSGLEFWSGARDPVCVATIAYGNIESIEWLEDLDHFGRPELRAKSRRVPLYAAPGWLRLSRRSSRNLYDALASTWKDRQRVTR